MSYRAGDPRLGYRRQGTHADVRDHFDYSASDRQRPFGQEESNRNVPNRNAKYYAMESDYRGRLSKDRHSSKDQEIQDFELATGSNHGSTRLPSASRSEMRKQPGEDAAYKLNAAKGMSVEDEDMFLYGSETSNSVYLKDYMHGQKELEKTSADDGNLSMSEVAAAGKQDYDPTIENILKSIGFNIDLSQVVTEPASKTEATVEKKRATAIQTSEPSVMVSEASTLRGGFSKKIDSILPAQDTYEARARRYREEQTRMYAEANAGSDLAKTAPKLTPAVSGRSSLELLQSSYDYDAVVKEFGKGIESKELERDNWARNERETHNAEDLIDLTDTNRSKRALYEDFSDSDDNLSDTEKPTKMKTEVDHFEAESQRSIASSPRFGEKAESKSRVRSGKEEAKAKVVEPSYHSSNIERISSAERSSKNVREPESTEKTSTRQVKIIPSTIAAAEANSGRNSSGNVRYVVGSKWDSPNRDGPLDIEIGARIVANATVTAKRQLKIQSLSNELDRLKQEQKEIMRRKHRGRLGHKDPELLENSRYQANISVEIDRLMKFTDEEYSELEARQPKKSPSTERKVVACRQKAESSALTAEINSIKSEKKSDLGHKDRPKLQKMVVHYDYFDDGGHWCQSCNSVFNTIDELCQHLHSSKHQEKMDLNHRPWAPKDAAVKKGFKGVPVPIKGVEFLMPTQAFYCSLCCVFAGDAQCAHDHLKSNEHNESYQRLLENDTTYEHHYNLDKEAAMSLIGKMQLLENKKDTGTQKFSSATKRPSFLKPSTDESNAKRTKLSSEFSAKSLSDNYSDTQDETSPADDKVNNALSDRSHSDKRGSNKAKDPASNARSTLASKTALPLNKPAFIGKLPCLTGPRNRTPISRFARTNGVAAKGLNESSDTKQASLNVVQTSQVQEDVGESQNALKFSTLCSSEDGLTSRNKSHPVAVDDLRERDDRISSTVGQRLGAIKSSSKSSVECSQDSSGNQEGNTKPKKNGDPPSCVTEEMSLGDFEIFDECDAE